MSYGRGNLLGYMFSSSFSKHKVMTGFLKEKSNPDAHFQVLFQHFEIGISRMATSKPHQQKSM